MATSLKNILIGAPLATEQQHHQRLSKRIALAVFSSDALSSVAYASEAILGILVLAGAAYRPLVIPISVAIVVLLLIVGISYRQTIHAYPNGGGAYIVAHDNLGQVPGLIAAAALLIDYVLTVAVSISAGVFQIASLATTWGYPWLGDYRVEIALVCITIITLINLRGVKESGLIFSVPTYVFVFSVGVMVILGFLQVFASGGTAAARPAHVPEAVETFGLFLLLRAFAAGCTALTGVEAISNGVPAFNRPEAKNAATTLLWMIGILGALFLGISVLAHYVGAAYIPEEESVISQVARQVVGTGSAYFVIQVATAFILVLAANTSYADFPRLASLLSKDRFLPRQFSSRGDRLVFSNGILALGVFSALLVVFFDAREHAMLPLYAIGVFISFTLSQFGMVRHWLRLREPGWQRGVAINATGAALTAMVMVVIILTKFMEGAWAVLLLTPIMVLLFRSVYRHYQDVAQQLSLVTTRPAQAVQRHTALVLVSGIHRGVVPALRFATSIAPDNTTALYVDLDPEATEKVRAKWAQWGCNVPLEILDSPYRSLIRPILRYIDELDARYDDDVLSVILPEFIPSKWWQHLLHNQTALLLKAALLFRKGVVVTSVPYHLDH